MTAWWDGRAVLWDLETDGIDPEDARIITAAVVFIRPNDATATVTYMAQPERDIPAEATAVHGITTDYATESGGPRKRIVTEMVQTMCMAEARPLIGHNIGKFDLTILDRELRRLGIGSLGHEHGKVTVRVDGRQVGAFHVIDTLCMDKWVDPYRKGRRTLDATAAHYGVPIRGDAHTAEADALAAGRVAWAIAKRCDTHGALLEQLYGDRKRPGQIVDDFHALGEMTLPELHRNQVLWAAEQAAGLRDYFARNPDRGDPLGVSSAWPLEPVGTVDAVTDLV